MKQRHNDNDTTKTLQNNNKTTTKNNNETTAINNNKMLEYSEAAKMNCGSCGGLLECFTF